MMWAILVGTHIAAFVLGLFTAFMYASIEVWMHCPNPPLPWLFCALSKEYKESYERYWNARKREAQSNKAETKT